MEKENYSFGDNQNSITVTVEPENRVNIVTKYDFIEIEAQDVPELIKRLSTIQGNAAIKTEPKAVSSGLDELFHYLEELCGYGGDGIGNIVECMGNLISNNVILERIANGKTSDYSGAGNVDDNVCSGNTILHYMIEALMAYRKIKN